MSLKMYDLAGAEPERRFSPYCWRAKLALAHKGLGVETIPWRFTEKSLLPQPNKGLVPVLVDGDRTLADSWAIANHLETSYPERPSLFGGEQARALTQVLNSWCDTAVHATLARLVINDIYEHVAPQDRDYFRTTREARWPGKTLPDVQSTRDQDVTAFRNVLNPVRQALADRPFLGGDKPMYADYIFMGCFLWVRGISSFEPLAADDASLRGWRARVYTVHRQTIDRSPGYDWT